MARLRGPFTLFFAAVTFLLLGSISTTIGFVPSRQFARKICARKMREETTMETWQKINSIGSSPPTCRSKCGKCAPCTPVRVPVRPGFDLLLEYYPEAWRCKCGDQIFMP
ncbi:EPIDERMAL PATTERNING FACTOR-like protein 5 [Andrographis paniculata]|uniref:EPIDERMAL PATTERNING FACTOR-like protein 5 n=1 Tax=Andrographis paniculata TaxID=175694 RepID=UPI0021E86E53|nr:EPIDERMAL PATTERNING FACTOR-like protein 5 [Andrographis paniculata]